MRALDNRRYVSIGAIFTFLRSTGVCEGELGNRVCTSEDFVQADCQSTNEERSYGQIKLPLAGKGLFTRTFLIVHSAEKLVLVVRRHHSHRELRVFAPPNDRLRLVKIKLPLFWKPSRKSRDTVEFIHLP